MPLYKGGENRFFPSNADRNSIAGMAQRIDGLCLCAEAHITANNETKNLNVFSVNGTIDVLDQYAIITEITALTNMTNVYADFTDGLNIINLTKTPGNDFSNIALGSFFKRNQLSSATYTLSNANQVRLIETLNRDAGIMTLTGKNGGNNYIRFNFTTNTILDFKMLVFFVYKKINGGTIQFV
jgi:hypothetical protein